MPRGASPGERRGGRQRGTPNKRTQEQIARVRETGITPLEYLLQVMRDEQSPAALRLDAATRAAPYVHPRLAAVDVDLTSAPRCADGLTDDELLAIACGDDVICSDGNHLLCAPA